MHSTMQNDHHSNSHQGNATEQPIIAQQQQTVFVRPAGPRTFKVSSSAFLGLGITQIVLGVITFLVQIVAIIISMQPSFSLAGMYCPIIYIIAGAFGIISSRKKTMCHTVAFMVLCILSAVFTISQLISTVIAAMFLAPNLYGYEFAGGIFSLLFGGAVILAVLALAECVVAIICACMCCKAVCCGNSNETMVAYTQAEDGETMIPLMVFPNQVSGGAAGGVGLAPMAPGYALASPSMPPQNMTASPLPEKMSVD